MATLRVACEFTFATPRRLSPPKHETRAERKFCLTLDEARRLRNLPEAEQVLTFFRLWGLKEAHLKAHGAQVPAGLSCCDLALEADGPRLCKSDFESQASQNVLAEIPVTKGYTAAIAGLQGKDDISVFDL